MPGSIRLKTAIPGPRSLELAARRERAIPRGIGHATPVYADTASGALVTDVDGNVLIDFAGGIGTMNVGHGNPEVVRAASEQLRKLTHTCFSVAPYESYVALAETLNRITPGAFPKKTMLANSGAEALENAVKIARHATGRDAVVVFDHAFHGRTLMTLSMTSKVFPYKLGFGPFAPEVYRLPFPYEYRGHYAGPWPPPALWTSSSAPRSRRKRSPAWSSSSSWARAASSSRRASMSIRCRASAGNTGSSS